MKMAIVTDARSTLVQMIADAGFTPDRYDPDITERNFPLEYEGSYNASGLNLFGGDREWSINEVEAAVTLEGGCLEGLVRGMAYLKTNPNALKDGPIILPASSWVFPDGSARVLFAGLGGGKPWLDLNWSVRSHRWPWHYRFLVSGKPVV